MIKIEEGEDGTLLYVEGEDKTPVDDPELQALLRSFTRLQETLDKDKAPEKVTEAFVTSGVRLLVRLAATLGSRMQDLAVDLGEVAEAAESGGGEAAAPEGILFTIDEARLLVGPLFSAAQIFGNMAQGIAQAPQDPNLPPREQMAAQYAQLQEMLGMGAGRITLGLRAYEAAAAEEAAAEAAEAAEAGDDDTEDDEEEDEA